MTDAPATGSAASVEPTATARRAYAVNAAVAWTGVALTVVVWAVWGPRGWVTARLVPWALAVPALWIVWMLVRGAVVDAYPYGFANVAELGYGVVARNLVLVLLFALALAAAFWRLDVVLRRRRGAPA